MKPQRASTHNLARGPISRGVPRNMWIEGEPDTLRGAGRVRVAIIGSRIPRVEAAEWTIALVRTLAELPQVTVVSGMARGVDTVAHWTCLGVGLATVAVLPCSITDCYPRENRMLRDLIVRYGLVVSPFGPGTRLTRDKFARRNRVIAALSDAIMVVEAGEKSGTRWAVGAAIEFQKPVYFGPWVDMRAKWAADAMRQGEASVYDRPCYILEAIRPVAGQDSTGGTR